MKKEQAKLQIQQLVGRSSVSASISKILDEVFDYFQGELRVMDEEIKNLQFTEKSLKIHIDMLLSAIGGEQDDKATIRND